MRNKAKKLTIPVQNGNSQNYDVKRIIDQAVFDEHMKFGTCFVCALASAIESRFDIEFKDETIIDFCTAGEFVFERFGKSSQALHLSNLEFFREGKNIYKAVKLRKKAIKNLDFKALKDFVSRNECTILSLSIRSSFYSGITGKFYKTRKLSGGHAVRLIYKDDKVYIVNSWGESWAKGGIVELKPEHFEHLKIWQLVGCDFEKIEKKS